jgi:hypothetical protein
VRHAIASDRAQTLLLGGDMRAEEIIDNRIHDMLSRVT